MYTPILVTGEEGGGGENPFANLKNTEIKVQTKYFILT